MKVKDAIREINRRCKSDNEMVEDIKNCSTCFYERKVCPGVCDYKYSAWKCVNGKGDAEVVEDVEKSCGNCKHVNKEMIYCVGIGCGRSLSMWRSIEATEEKQTIETADPSKIIKGSEQRRRLDDEYEKQQKEATGKIFANTDTLVVTNSKGAKQSKIDTAFSLVPHDSLLAVAKVMKTGSERYEKDNWRKLTTDEIYDHLMEHLVNWHMTGNMEDLEHGITRAMMLYSVANDGQ